MLLFLSLGFFTSSTEGSKLVSTHIIAYYNLVTRCTDNSCLVWAGQKKPFFLVLKAFSYKPYK